MTPFIDTTEVASLIGFRTVQSFRRNRARLERDEGFPRPMPTSLSPLMWRRTQIESWLAAQGSPATDKPIRPLPQLRLIEMAQTR